MRRAFAAVSKSKAVRGFSEGGALVAATELLVSSLVGYFPSLESQRVNLAVLVGTGLGSLVRIVFAVFWKLSRE